MRDSGDAPFNVLAHEMVCKKSSNRCMCEAFPLVLRNRLHDMWNIIFIATICKLMIIIVTFIIASYEKGSIQKQL